ncbi:GMC oxidoreductase [Hyaloscypha variabilis F]|uniref:GMC oxidoreductase n=1 Tax=Hyaloscypha variabilis (strain UAMH 11265 / GT02V1 / F) TaxID=1149755 RepID=A0A2J6R188_HYAVF|nr:GMC oxidoreductase [Hyaloscypha variabilis F]
MVSLSATLLIAFSALVSAQPGRLYSSCFAIPGNASYDYVVVGGGTAGLAIAKRLAETASVAVIEAGGVYEIENGNQSVVPYFALTMGVLSTSTSYPRQPLVDWDLISQPVAGAGDKRIHYARGKTLGGCSALNTMGYLRGSVGTHQRWADLVGDDSYTWENVLPYFKKSATFTPPNLAKRFPANATVQFDPTVFDNSLNGPIQVSYGNWIDVTTTWLAVALQAIGMPLGSLGFNSGVLSGFGDWVTDEIKPEDATRSSSEAGYLRQAIADPNSAITVYTHTQASKILFDSNKTANGVLVNTAGFEYIISATQEVILSAGVFHSPQLLMLSGIGPAATLESFDIPVISNMSGVGQNLWDQIFFDVLSGVNLPAFIPTPENEASTLQSYLQDQEGPYSSAGGYVSFEKIPQDLRQNFSQRTQDLLATLPEDWPEIEYIVLAYPGANSTIGAVSATIEAPFSRGNVTISSSSITDPPVINLNWLSDPADEELLVAAFRRCRQAWDSPAIQQVRVGPEIAPGLATQTDEEILAWIRLNLGIQWHASSSNKMGVEGDPLAVVDSKARVFGVQGLRVVDVSSIPFSVPGHPSGTAYMLAEKIADDIKNGN